MTMEPRVLKSISSSLPAFRGTEKRAQSMLQLRWHFAREDGTSDPEVDSVLLPGVSWYGEVCAVDASVTCNSGWYGHTHRLSKPVSTTTNNNQTSPKQHPNNTQTMPVAWINTLLIKHTSERQPPQPEQQPEQQRRYLKLISHP